MAAAAFCWYPIFPGFPCFSAETWAAWVQAIGSIIAILVAVAVPAYQHRQDRRDKRDGRAALVRALGLHVRPILLIAARRVRRHTEALSVNLQDRQVTRRELTLPVSRQFFELTVDQISECPPAFQYLLYLVSVNELAVDGEVTLDGDMRQRINTDRLSRDYFADAEDIAKYIQTSLDEFEAVYEDKKPGSFKYNRRIE